MKLTLSHGAYAELQRRAANRERIISASLLDPAHFALPEGNQSMTQAHTTGQERALSEALTASELKLLEYLAQNAGCDIYGYGDAMDGRSLERKGLVEIVKAQKPPKSVRAKQPYYGIKISSSGREWLAKSGLLRRGLSYVW